MVDLAESYLGRTKHNSRASAFAAHPLILSYKHLTSRAPSHPGALTAGAGLFALLFSLPFWAASGSMITALVNQFVKTELTIGDYFYRLDKKVAGMKR